MPEPNFQKRTYIIYCEMIDIHLLHIFYNQVENFFQKKKSLKFTIEFVGPNVDPIN